MFTGLLDSLKGFLITKVTAILTIAVTGYLLKNNIDDASGTIVGYVVTTAVGIIGIVFSLIAHKLALQANVVGITNVAAVPQKENLLGTK